jgi:hypothetical protein
MPSSDDPKEALEPFNKFLAAMQKISAETAAQEKVRLLEAENQRLSLQNTHEYSMALLKAQQEDRDDQRTVDVHNAKGGFWLIALVLVLLGTFFMFALYRNKDAVVIEVLKTTGLFFAGFASGWGIRSSKGAKSKPDENAK